jgi:hypothetical protein
LNGIIAAADGVLALAKPTTKIIPGHGARVRGRRAGLSRHARGGAGSDQKLVDRKRQVVAAKPASDLDANRSPARAVRAQGLSQPPGALNAEDWSYPRPRAPLKLSELFCTRRYSPAPSGGVSTRAKASQGRILEGVVDVDRAKPDRSFHRGNGQENFVGAGERVAAVPFGEASSNGLRREAAQRAVEAGDGADVGQTKSSAGAS